MTLHVLLRRCLDRPSEPVVLVVSLLAASMADGIVTVEPRGTVAYYGMN